MLIKGFSDLSVTRTGMRQDRVCDLNWGAYCRLDNDVSELFPYINAAVDKARYQVHPHHVRFAFKDVLCTLYPAEAMVAPLRGRDHALIIIEDLIAFLNDLYARRHSVQPDHQVYQQPASIVDIVKSLPRSNCRECGYPTCMAFAAAVRNGDAVPSDCPDFVRPISVNTVYPILKEDGTIAATFTIETEPDPPESRTEKAPESAPSPSEAPQPREPLYDPHGIRIQYDLTPREIQVLRLMAEGSSNPEISDLLGISPHTVKSHVIHIFNKLNVNDRTQASVWAVQNGVI